MFDESGNFEGPIGKIYIGRSVRIEHGPLLGA
jgi:hypothetical protein